MEVQDEEAVQAERRVALFKLAHPELAPRRGADALFDVPGAAIGKRPVLCIVTEWSGEVFTYGVCDQTEPWTFYVDVDLAKVSCEHGIVSALLCYADGHGKRHEVELVK